MNMGTRTLGRTGLEVGVIGLGTEHLSANRENMDAVFDLAVEAGVNYIDLIYNDPLDVHADFYPENSGYFAITVPEFME